MLFTRYSKGNHNNLEICNLCLIFNYITDNFWVLKKPVGHFV